MKEINVTGQKRTDLGKKASKTLRKEGLIPCNLYGEKKGENGAPEALSFAVPFAELRKIIYTPHVYVINLIIDGESHTAIMKEIQFHPTTDAPLHVDFYEVNDKKPITIGIPVKLTGLAQGVRDGGRMNLSFSYRNDWLELSLDGTLNYNHATNKLQPNSNLNTWQFSYGPSMTLTAPWGTSLNSSLSISSRRGYSDSSMNTDEFVWNAQLSQGFLKGKPLTIMLQFYDILRQQSTFSRAISATSRTDTEYNAINSYAMLHVIYRLNLFGGKDARRGGPEGPGGPGGRPNFHGRPFNGVFGGGRPGGRMF